MLQQQGRAAQTCFSGESIVASCGLDPRGPAKNELVEVAVLLKLNGGTASERVEVRLKARKAGMAKLLVMRVFWIEAYALLLLSRTNAPSDLLLKIWLLPNIRVSISFRFRFTLCITPGKKGSSERVRLQSVD